MEALTGAEQRVLVGVRQEVGQGNQERSQRQQQPSRANHPRAVHSAAKVADEDDEDHIANLERAQ